MYDTKTRWDRIGDYIFLSSLKKIALPIIYASLVVMICMGLATVFINKTTAELNYKHSIADIRYENIKHN